MLFILGNIDELKTYAENLDSQLPNLKYNLGPITYKNVPSRPETEELLGISYPQEKEILRSLTSTGDGDCLSRFSL